MMNAKEMITTMKTVGAIAIYDGRLAFMVGPNKAGNELGIVRFGGHIEEGEYYLDALQRELMEEISISGNIIDSVKTYHIRNWDDKVDIEIEFDGGSPRPFFVKGDEIITTAVFIVELREKPIPSSETHGIIYLNKEQIVDICNNKMTLNDFIKGSGIVDMQKKVNYNLQLKAGIHLQLIYDMLKDNHVYLKSLLNNVW